MAVVLETTVGDITIDLYVQYRPRACLNFLKLCKVKYYNFCTFHKIERNFIAQTGDPTGTGRGGESVFFMLYGEQAKFFDAEVSPRLKHQKLGTVSMVNNGDNAHGSQFFITLGEDLDYLDGTHTVFGEVTEGLEILTKLNDAICDEEHRPYQDILITHTVILDDPFDDPPGLTIPDRSPEPTAEHLQSSRIGATEDIDDTKGKSIDEIEEEIKEKEAKARATILEMIGDIPDAEIKPPDTVLFVCKLNPVTTAEDLEVIFSRFGPIKSCEVICDRKTGESLQYAFIEFEKPEDCESAYFKMDNVLIDDRRIHVDFSQSVSKIKWKGRYDPKNQVKNKGSNFVIKEKAQEKKDDNYQMVFESDNDEAAESKSPKKSKKDKDIARITELKEKKKARRPKTKKHKKKHSSESSSDSESPKQYNKPDNRKTKKKTKKESSSSSGSSNSSDSESEHKTKPRKGHNSSNNNSNENHNKTKTMERALSPSPHKSLQARERSSKGSLPRRSRSPSSQGRLNDTRHSKRKSEERHSRYNRSTARSRSRSRSRSRERSYRGGEQSREGSASTFRNRDRSRERSRRNENRDRRGEREHRRKEDSRSASRRHRSRTPDYEKRRSSKSGSRRSEDHYGKRHVRSRSSRSSS